jgi:DNA gyrase/topoisomerase IV subunit A
MKLKYLIIANSRHDEIIHIYKNSVSNKTIIKHLTEYLEESDWYIEYINSKDAQNISNNEFDKIKYFLMEYHDTFTNVIETKLEQ